MTPKKVFYCLSIAFLGTACAVVLLGNFIGYSQSLFFVAFLFLGFSFIWLLQSWFMGRQSPRSFAKR